jgi:hypothetical protein
MIGHLFTLLFGRSSGPPPVVIIDLDRVYRLPPEARVRQLPAELRVHKLPPEDRIHTLDAEVRTYRLPPESRIYRATKP